MALEKISIINRIKDIFAGLTQSDIAKICAVKQPTINRYFKKGLLPNHETMLRIANYAGVSIEWILTGKESKGLSIARESTVGYEPIAAVHIITSSEYKKLIEENPEIEGYTPIPLISGIAAAGNPFIIDERDIEGFAIIYRTWIKRGHKYRCLRVRGESMHPVISDGFIVAIDLNENNPKKLLRQIVAARHEGIVTIKYLITDSKNYILFPHNTEEYVPIIIPLTEPNPIIGKVAWWWGRAK